MRKTMLLLLCICTFIITSCDAIINGYNVIFHPEYQNHSNELYSYFPWQSTPKYKLTEIDKEVEYFQDGNLYTALIPIICKTGIQYEIHFSENGEAEHRIITVCKHEISSDYEYFADKIDLSELNYTSIVTIDSYFTNIRDDKIGFDIYTTPELEITYENGIMKKEILSDYPSHTEADFYIHSSSGLFLAFWDGTVINYNRGGNSSAESMSIIDNFDFSNFGTN